MKKLLLALVSAPFFILGQALAQVIEVRDQVTIDIPTGLFSNAPSAELKAEARKQGVDRAWRRYMAQNFSGARAQQAAAHERQLRELPDKVCNFTFYDEKFDKDAKTFSLQVRASCDQRAVDAAFAALAKSAGSPSPDGVRKRGPVVGFVFLARRAATETNESEVSSTVSTTGTDGTVDSQRGNTQGSTSSTMDSASVTQSARKSSTTRDAVFSYEVESTDDAMTSVANSLQSNGFRVARYPDIVTQCTGPSMGDLSRRYAGITINTAWSPKDTKGMFEAARQCKVPYFAFGLMEVLKSRQVGLKSFEVVVALNVRVSDLTEMLPTECASMSRQFAGRGSDRVEAARSALKIAGEEGSRELIDIIRANCI